MKTGHYVAKGTYFFSEAHNALNRVSISQSDVDPMNWSVTFQCLQTGHMTRWEISDSEAGLLWRALDATAQDKMWKERP